SVGPVLFVLNHPNGLIDPGFLLCLAPRRVSFLAKAPLFRMPLVGWLCRTFQAIPVHRRQDAGADPARNRETFEAARRVLAGAGASRPGAGSATAVRAGLSAAARALARPLHGAAGADRSLRERAYGGGARPSASHPADVHLRARAALRRAECAGVRAAVAAGA